MRIKSSDKTFPSQLESSKNLKTITMNIATINLDNICRSCLSEEGQLTSIFNTMNTNDVRVVDMFKKCSFLLPEEDDCLPNKICLKCYTCINDAYQFKMQCDKSDVMLRTLLKTHMEKVKIIKIDSIETNIEEEEEYIEDNPEYETVIVEAKIDDEHDEPMDINNEINEIKLEIETDTKAAFKCGQCDENFTTNKDFSSHNFIHHSQVEAILCPQCGKRCQNDDILAVHLRHCQLHECIVCNKAFKSVGFLQNHMKKHDPDYAPEPGEKKYKCLECGKSYTSPANLQIHQFSHSGVKPFKCEFCDKGFTKMTSLNTHLSVHTGLRSHQCPECGKAFTSASILNQHKKIHSGVRPYKCAQCPRSFVASGDLTVHMRMHTGEKPYLCPTCGRGFARITHLNTHIRTHTGERPFVCNECGRGFAQSGDLRSHERTHTGERPYACNLCDRKFAQSSGLASHMTTHSKVKSYKCDICNKAFSQSSSVLRHAKTHILNTDHVKD